MQNKDWLIFDTFSKEINKIKICYKNLSWQLKTSDGVKNDCNNSSLNSSIGYLQGLIHEKLNSKEFIAAVTNLYRNKKLSKIEQKALEYWSKEIKEATKLSKAQSIKRVELKNSVNQKWEEARKNNDFCGYKEYLKELIEFEKEIYSIIYDKPADYNLFLDKYAPGWKTADIDKVFEELKIGLLPIIKKVKDYKLEQFDFINRPVKKDQINKILEIISIDMGYDFSKGRIAYSAHPFSSSINAPYDVRYTVRYIPDNPTVKEMIDNILAGMHECGHAIVGQNSPVQHEKLGVGEIEVDLHESQSRMWENIIGRSKEFWMYLQPKLVELCPEVFSDILANDLYRYVNVVGFSPIRIESDEFCYNFHIILRYELEKMFFDKNFDYQELATLWDVKNNEYFGITPKSYIEGILQDMHWSLGYIGYFPSYTLGNIMSAQIFNFIKKENKNLMDEISKGNFQTLRIYLIENIYKVGKKYSGKELVEKITKKPLSSKYLIEYLNKKYTQIYEHEVK